MDDYIQKLVRRHKTKCPFELSSRLGITVWFEDLGQSTRGFYFKKLRRRYICIHSELNETWARFVCAHELGHDRLHPGINRFFLDEATLFNAGKYERQANRFAVSLLTFGSSPDDGESSAEFLMRNNVPTEMIRYL